MLEEIGESLVNITSDQIALISVLVTILIYLLGKKSELKFKKHELKKEKYMEFITLLKEAYLSKGEINLDENFKLKLFDFGATIFIYGSKKMYKKYCFFREISSDFIKQCKFYNDQISLFLVADMLNQIRKEIGMYDFESYLNYKSISFFTNDIYFNPKIRLNWCISKLNVTLIKLELFLYKIIELVPLKILLNIFSFPFKMVIVFFKCFVSIPFGKFLVKIGLTEEKLNKIIEKLNNYVDK